MSESNVIMWILTIILLIGFILTYKNLDGERVLTNSKYEGLVISILALLGSIYVGVNTANGGFESFKSLHGK